MLPREQLEDGDALRFGQTALVFPMQDRTFDLTVLVAAAAKLRVPVSCVEAGRWEAAREHEPLAPAPQAAYPELRAAKSRHVMRS